MDGNMNYSTQTEARKIAHLEAKSLIEKGELREALDVLKEAIRTHGAHVGILSDIVFVSYMLNEITLYQKSVENLEQEFLQAQNKLSPESLIRSYIFIGKVKETAADVFSALKYYKLAYANSAEDSLKLRAAAQLIRLNSFLGNNEELHNYYIFMNSRRDLHSDTDVEIMHALMLSDLRLFGKEASEVRMHSLLDRELAQPDIQQISLHFLAECLRLGVTPEKNLLKKLFIQLNFNTMNSYEKEIAGSFYKIEKINDLPCHDGLDEIKRLALLIQKSDNKDIQDVYKKMFLFRIKTLSKDSRMLIEGIFKNLFKVTSKSIEIKISERNVFINEVEFSGPRAAALSTILKHFSNIKTVESQIIACKIFEICEYGPVEFNRFRILIYRINKDLEAQFGLLKVLRLTKNNLELNLDANVIS